MREPTGTIGHQLAALESVFAARLPEAAKRAAALRERKLMGAVWCSRRAQESAERTERLLAQIETEGDWCFRSDGTVRDLLAELADEIERALESEGRAARLSGEVEQIDALAARYQARPADEGAGPTAEMLRRLREGELSDALMRLAQLGHIDEGELRTAREIARIVERVNIRTGAVTTHFPTTERIDRARDPAAAPTGPTAAEWYDWLHARVYVPWWRKNRAEARIVLALAVDGVSLETARRRYRCGWGTALQQLREGLADYQRVRAAACRGQ